MGGTMTPGRPPSTPRVFDPRRGILHEPTSDAAARRGAWADLASGRCRLVARDASSSVAASHEIVENAPELHASLRLTPTEVAAVGAAASAMPGKLIAYSLGVAPSTVSSVLRSAATKLGLSSTTELARVVRVLVSDGATPAIDDTSLSPAEREILAMLLAGDSNAAIARARRRSERTVANQVSAILRKTGCPSRGVLRILADGWTSSRRNE